MNKKEMSTYIKKNSDKPKDMDEYKRVEAYYERMDDPDNLSLEKWHYLIEGWTLELFRIYGETGFDDESYYSQSIITDLKRFYEAPIEAFIDVWKNEMRQLTPYMSKWHSISTKEEFEKEFPDFEKEGENVKQRFSKEDYYAFLEKKESDGFTPGKYSETERLISTGSSIRVHKRNWIKKRGFDDNIPQIFEVLKADWRISENKITSILNPPSKFYLKSLINRIMHHSNHPDGDYYREKYKVVEKKDVNGDKIFLVEPK